MRILRLRIACWITKVTYTTRTTRMSYYCFPTTAAVARKRLNVTPSAHCLSRYLRV